MSHLFVVPSIRTSHYVHMLSSAFPSLFSTTPGEIQEEGLPHLRHLVVFDDAAASVPGSGRSNDADTSGMKPWQETRAAVDFREIMSWDENGREAKIVQDVASTLEKDDIANLQFTR